MKTHPITESITNILAFVITYVFLFSATAALLLLVSVRSMGEDRETYWNTSLLRLPYSEHLHEILMSPGYWTYHALACVVVTMVVMLLFNPRRNMNNRSLLEWLTSLFRFGNR